MKKVIKSSLAVVFITVFVYVFSSNVKADPKPLTPCYMDYSWVDCMCFAPMEQCILTYCGTGCEGVIVNP